MDEAAIREMVEGRRSFVEPTESWFTPAGNQRTAPLYEGEVRNEYLQKSRTIKARSMGEFEAKVNECLGKWAEQEIKKRVVDGKRDAKEKARAEAIRKDGEAKQLLEELNGLLAATLDVDDKIDWDAERDTRKFRRFSYGQPPRRPVVQPATLPPKPGWTWLLPGRLRRWELQCSELLQRSEAVAVDAERRWREAVQEHERAHAAAKEQHAKEKQLFLSKQERFNHALAHFRQAFEAGDEVAIKEYCSRVLERSQYPDCISMTYSIDFDSESRFVVVELELPTPDSVLATSGYKFVSKGNRVEPVSLKKKETTALRKSVQDQIIVRTIHEIIESCYVDSVAGVLLNGWVTTLDKATGNDSRKRVCSVMAPRAGFESLDLARVDPAACIARLAEGVGQLNQA